MDPKARAKFEDDAIKNIKKNLAPAGKTKKWFGIFYILSLMYIYNLYMDLLYYKSIVIKVVNYVNIAKQKFIRKLSLHIVTVELKFFIQITQFLIR